MKVAVIGAGPAGLTTAKHMVQCGIKPLVFERLPIIGGMWSPMSGKAWGDTMTTNLSKYTCCFSDHPWNKEIDIFPTKLNVYEYLLEYKSKYLSDNDFALGCEVLSIEQSTNNNSNNDNNNLNWIVKWKDSNNSILEDQFNYVVVATGFFGGRFIPPNVLTSDFKGRVSHSNEFNSKNLKSYEGKRVAVIGGSHNAAEIASNVAFYARSVIHLSTKPFWPFPRFLPVTPQSSTSSYLPLDLLFYQRPVHDSFEPELFIDPPQKLLTLHNYFSQFHPQPFQYVPSSSNQTLPPVVVISDYYTQMFQSGKIDLRVGRMTEVDENGRIHYLNNDQTSTSTSTDSVDEIIFCTGYQTTLPFFSSELKAILQFQNDDQFVPLLAHRSMIHPELPGLGFVGMYRGPYFGIMEKQAHWLSMVFSSQIPTPSSETQLSGIEVEKSIREQSPRPQFPHGNMIGMMDGLAKDLGLTRGESEQQQQQPESTTESESKVEKRIQVVTPFNYRSNSSSINSNVENVMKESMTELISKCSSGFLRGRVVYMNMIGHWNFSRVILNHLDATQSGSVEGTASFLPSSSFSSSSSSTTSTADSTNSQSVFESLWYHEEGIFTLNRSTPLQMSIQRDDLYSYNSFNDSIDIHFIKQSIKAEHFLTLRFQTTEERNWWIAESDHWCSPDTYTAKYEYAFSGLNLNEIRVEIICKGPKKDYKTITSFTRPIKSNLI